MPDRSSSERCTVWSKGVPNGRDAKMPATPWYYWILGQKYSNERCTVRSLLEKASAKDNSDKSANPCKYSLFSLMKHKMRQPKGVPFGRGFLERCTERSLKGVPFGWFMHRKVLVIHRISTELSTGGHPEKWCWTCEENAVTAQDSS